MSKIIKVYQYSFLIIIFLLLGNLLAPSQVTIGSALKPNQGSLLDLKMFAPTSNNTTATKGLLLPRVKLKKLRGDLSETLSSSTPYANNEHVGLVVFHIDDSECPITPSDIYIWTGASWSGLSTAPIKDSYSYTESSDGTGILTDYEGNQYTTKRFRLPLADGTEYNQVWMTQNLRSLKNAKGQWINCPSGINFNPGYYSNSNEFKIINDIPDALIGTYTNAGTVISNQTYESFIHEFGLMYPPSLAKEACPKGWHLPSKNEWENLLIALGGEKDGNNFLSIGDAMKTNNGEKYVAVDGRTNTWGATNITPNGFNAVPAGYVDSNTKRPKYFGYYTGFQSIEYIIVINTTNTVSTSSTNTSLHYSVRCIKDIE